VRRRNSSRYSGSAVSIVMKDTTRFVGEPARATQWASMARRLAEETAGRG
jgi:hypothetical protein